MNSGFLILVLALFMGRGGLWGQALPALSLAAPYAFSEGEGALAVAVDLPKAVGTDTVVTVTATLLTPPSQQIAIPAGARRGFLVFLMEDDALIQGPRQTVLRASAEGYAAARFAVLITDDDQAELSLELTASLREGGAGAGAVGLSRAAGYPVVVSLAATPAGLVLPTSVTIPAGFTRYSFAFAAAQDERINDDFSVAVSASIAAWGVRASAEVKVANDDLRNLVLEIPGSVSEDAVGLTGKVRLAGTLEAALEVALTSNQTAALRVPTSVTIAAGAREAVFALEPVNNPLATGARVAAIEAAAPGFDRVRAEVSVADATLASLELGSAPQWAAMGSAVSLTAGARNVDGGALLSYGEPLQAEWEKAATGEAVGAAREGAFSGGVANLSVEVPNILEPLRLRLSSGGQTARSGAVWPYRLLQVKAAALEVDRQRQRLLFTSGPGAGAGWANSLVALDPATGALTSFGFIGSDPRGLAVTDDGALAYIGLWSSGQVVPYNLASQSLGRSFSLSGKGYPWNSLSYFPVDLETVPGRPEGVVVAQQATGSSYRTTALYAGGAIVADRANPDFGSLARSQRPGVIFGFNNGDSGFDFGSLLGSAGELVLQRSVRSPFAGYGVGIEASGDLVIGSNGVVADGKTLLGRGRLALPEGAASWAVEADAGARRFYAAEASRGLFIFDAVSLQLVRRLALPAGLGAIAQIKRWGEQGLALRLASGAVALVTHPDVAPSGPAADLGVAFDEAEGSLWENRAGEFSLTVKNEGPHAALAARVILVAAAESALSGVEGGGAAVALSGNSAVVELGDLAVGASRRVSFRVTSGVLGPQELAVSLLADSVDPNFSNDSDVLPLAVRFEDVLGAVHALPFDAVDVVAHPALPLLYVSTGKHGAADLADEVLEVEADSGRVRRRLRTGSSPGALAITDGGEFLYVALREVSQVLRVDLARFAVAAAIPLPFTPYTTLPLATDLVTLEGRPESLAVALSYYGVYVIDGDVARTEHTGVYAGSRLERGPSADTLLTYDDHTSGFAFTRLRLAASGAREEGRRPGFGEFGADFVSSQGFALSSNGYLIDGGDLSLRGIFPGMSSRGGTPALEMPRQRAYAVVDNQLASFDTNRMALVRKMALPASRLIARKTLRWGRDGLAIMQWPEFYFVENPGPGRLLVLRSDLVPTEAPYAIDFLLEAPLQGAVVRTPQIGLSGLAFAADGIGSVSVNGAGAGAVDAFGRWSARVSLEPGGNTLSLVATTAGVAPVSKEIVLRVTYDPLLPPDWMADMLPGEVASAELLEQDGDLDGWNTLAEFALGGDPKVAQGSLVERPEAGDPLLFAFWRPVGAGASSVALRLQVSADLKQWRSPAAAEVEWLSPGELSPNGKYQKARFRLAAGGPALFWRLWMGTTPSAAQPGSSVP